jgi:hypothetical protein
MLEVNKSLIGVFNLLGFLIIILLASTGVLVDKFVHQGDVAKRKYHH